MKKALIIIDMQKIFFVDPKNQLHNSEMLIENLKLLIQKARETHTQIIYIQHTSHEKNDELAENTLSWEIYDPIAPEESDKIIQKTSWDSFYKTELEDYLKQNEIEQLIFAGAQTEFCLDTTCRRAYSLGYPKNILVQDAHSTLNNNVLEADMIKKHHEATLGNRFVILKKTQNIDFV